MLNLEILSLAAVISFLVTAVFFDVKSRRIPNKLVLAVIALGFIFQIAMPHGRGLLEYSWGSVGVLRGFYGLLMGFGIFIPLYLLRMIGAGDVKLMAALGVWFGAQQMIPVILFTFLCGGILALSVIIWTRSFKQVAHNLRFMVSDTFLRASTGGSLAVPAPTHTSSRLPYAVAIAGGALFQIALLKGWYQL